MPLSTKNSEKFLAAQERTREAMAVLNRRYDADCEEVKSWEAKGAAISLIEDKLGQAQVRYDREAAELFKLIDELGQSLGLPASGWEKRFSAAQVYGDGIDLYPYDKQMRARVQPASPLYVYLNSSNHLPGWLEERAGPRLTVASSFLGSSHGTTTPDEVRQFDSNMHLIPPGLVRFGRQTRGIGIYNCNFNGFNINEAHHTDFDEDAWLMCFATELSGEVANRLSSADARKVTAVEIVDFVTLKRALDQQVGFESFFGPVAYTKKAQRHHFLKGSSEADQKEYRLVWPAEPPVLPKPVLIPIGTVKWTGLSF
ncbi:hypothetical protein [uncultured Sphingomonas sp.]|uniref:hypothetical protein n=1 Tax=uncultured Sphingomonas sp. TaxID=158754 RepID=UPI0035CA0327